MERSPREFIIRKGKPSAVILEIKDYLHLLEKIENSEDLREVESLKKKKLFFKPLENYLRKHRA